MKGRIVRHIAGNYQVLTDAKELYVCRATGKFRFDKIEPHVGDLVEFDLENVYITKIEERKNSLIRPTIANIDQALIITSSKEPNFASYITNKLISLITTEGIEPIIVLTKCDLGTDNIKEFIDDYKRAGYHVIETRSDDTKTYEPILKLLKDKVSVIAGQTGAGKSTLVNHLDKNLSIATQEISKHLGRGKHTTRHTELHQIGGGLIADTPGFSSFELLGVERDDIRVAFKDFRKMSAKCKFNNCMHINEPGCEVKREVEAGTIFKKRYIDYVKMVKEIENRKERY